MIIIIMIIITNSDSQDIQSGQRDEIRFRKLYHVNNEKRETTLNGRKGTTLPRKGQNAWKKGKVQILGNRSGQHQTSRY